MKSPPFPACGPEELLVNMYPGFSEKKGDCGSREVSLVPSSFLIGAGFNQVHPQGFSMEPENASLEKEKHLKPPVWGFHVKLQGCILYFCCKILKRMQLSLQFIPGNHLKQDYCLSIQVLFLRSCVILQYLFLGVNKNL